MAIGGKSGVGLRVLLKLGLWSAAMSCAVLLSQTARPAEQWPPEVQRVPADSPPLSPAEALRTFYMPPGYHVELVASEPLIQDPVAIDWDLQGRLWAVEMPGYMRDIAGSGEHDPIGRVVVLEDVDGDGRMDKRTVFADGLVLARSLKVLDRGVLVGEPPNVWLMHDRDGDLRMDSKELVTNQYGRLDGDPQNNANGFLWALDNRIYTAGIDDIYLRLKNGAFEVGKALQRGEWGVTQDDAGRIYRNTNESALHVDLVPSPYYARNPDLVRTRGAYERLADQNEELNTVWPVRPNPGTNRAYQTGIDRPDGSLAKFTAVCSPLVYRGDRLPSELYGDVFVAEPAANLVSRIVLSEDATTLRARKAYSRGEFLASTDERFRPVYLSNAPDGTLFVVDMYRGILEHRISLTVYLRDHSLAHKLEHPTGMGRIYRVVHETTRRDVSKIPTSSPALVDLLSHPNGWRRDTAQRMLVERGDRSVATSLRTLAKQGHDWRLRLQALWTLDGLDAIDAATAVAALGDSAREVRSAALRVAERWFSDPQSPVPAAVLERLDDGDWMVREQLAATLGEMAPAARDPAIVTLLERHGDDQIAVDAAISGLHGGEITVLQALLVRLDADAGGVRALAVPGAREQPGGPATAGTAEAGLTMLAATIVRSAREPAIQKLFAWVGDANRPAWQRSALMRGAEVVLLGAPMPGAPAARVTAAAGAVAMPCPTCPGGRAGPGGSYAFPRPEGWAQTVARGGGPALRLNSEPAALTAMAAGAEDLGARAKNLLAKIAWPGKQGEAARAAPLTTAQQQQFDAGREIYKNVCQACHQPDGRGRDKVAPTLIGSPFALAPPAIAIRILVNGKQGSIGLMPPIGSAMSDEQIADVLTYIRREWGQAGEPVERARVATVRAQIAGRTKPWTDEELRRLILLEK